MSPPFVSSLRHFWKLLSGSVHPDDEAVFAAYPEHTFNLDFPPPAFVGDVDNAPIVILMSNGGYWPGKTEKEFPTSHSAHEYRAYLHGDRSSLPANLSRYYMRGPLAEGLAEGSVVLVNAVAYRSRQLSSKSEAQNREVVSHYVSQLNEYVAVTGAVAGAVVFMTTGELIWIGDREKLLGQLQPKR